MSTISRAQLVALLAPTLGEDKGDAIVDAGMRSLGVAGDDIELKEAMSLLDDLAREEGLVGVAARFAKRRLQARALEEEIAPTSEHSRGADPSLRRSMGRTQSTRATITPIEVAKLLSATVGEEKSEEAVARAMRERGLPVNATLTRDEALAVLEIVARSEGIVGVTARFAKARLLLLLGS